MFANITGVNKPLPATENIKNLDFVAIKFKFGSESRFQICALNLAHSSVYIWSTDYCAFNYFEDEIMTLFFFLGSFKLCQSPTKAFDYSRGRHLICALL